MDNAACNLEDAKLNDGSNELQSIFFISFILVLPILTIVVTKWMFCNPIRVTQKSFISNILKPIIIK